VTSYIINNCQDYRRKLVVGNVNFCGYLILWFHTTCKIHEN